MGKTLLTIAIVLVVLVMTTLATMLGWHLFAVPVFGMEELDFFQALGLAVLIGLRNGKTKDN